MFQRCIRATIFMAFLGCTLSNASIDRISMIGNKFIELIEDPGVSVFDVRGLFGKELREMWARDRKAFLGEHYEVACTWKLVAKRTVRFGRKGPRYVEEGINNKTFYTFCMAEVKRLKQIIERYQEQCAEQLPEELSLLVSDEMPLVDEVIDSWNEKVSTVLEWLEEWKNDFYVKTVEYPYVFALCYHRETVS